ncbi:DUF4272 domain-containing protein [Pseudomarimonas arenosa]|uniref:DUF4272 domain-containing protein n=1 Tax=Pseudomarimonas arenosa TaxID=2774145 RepID=A0AAW3ZV92_9GAMM|nr:DUF4272 domain-containing protein [Pseudomarimonas arenosa]MBD8528217.1 DUF4272 domain-containing protein [Pseudomarimonas arenosa]
MSDDMEYCIRPRTAQEVAERSLALLAVTSRAFEDVPTRTLNWAKVNEIDKFFSDKEREFFFLPNRPDQRDINTFSWKIEALVSLLWALRAIEQFPPLNVQVDLNSVGALVLAYEAPSKFVNEAKLRPMPELEELENALYNQHWRVRDAQLFGRPMPVELNPIVVYERRYGMSWLVGWGEDWDDVPTDT